MPSLKSTLALSFALAAGCGQKQEPQVHAEAASSAPYKYCEDTAFLEGLSAHMPIEYREEAEVGYLRVHAMSAAFKARCEKAADGSITILSLPTSQAYEEGAQTCVDVYGSGSGGGIVCPEETRRR